MYGSGGAWRSRVWLFLWPTSHRIQFPGPSPGSLTEKFAQKKKGWLTHLKNKVPWQNSETCCLENLYPKLLSFFVGLKGQVPVKLLNLNGRLTTERNNSVVGTYQNWQWWVLCLLSVSRSSFCATGLYQIPNAHHGFRAGPGVITANSKTTTNPRKSVNSNILETSGRFWIETWARQCVYIYSCKLPPHSEFGS